MILDGAALDRMLHGSVTDPRTYLLRFYPDLPIPPMDVIAEQHVPLVAEVNGGRWIARCPCRARITRQRPEVGGGVVWLDQPLVWCARCRNRAVKGAWRRVVLPAEREAIEQVLSLRPDPETRGWVMGESVDDLVAENDAHGVGDQST